MLQEMEDLTIVSLNEKQRRAESDRREKLLKEQKDRFLLSKGITPREDEGDDDDDTGQNEEEEDCPESLRDHSRISSSWRPC